MAIKNNILQLFTPRKGEIAFSAFLLALTLVLNLLYIRKFYGVFWPLISGYDQFLLSTLTNWLHSPYLNSNPIYSHPGFGILVAPLSAVNYILSSISGNNCANFILAIILMAMFITETILLKRILNEHIGLKLSVSLILSTLFSGMAYVLLMSFTPDHFAFSQFFLILDVYLWTKKQQENRKMLDIVAICIGSITITNGIKTILSKLLFERKRFIKCLFLYTVVISSLILVSKLLTRNVIFSSNLGEMAYMEQEYKKSVNYKHFYKDKTDIETKCVMLDSTKCEKNRQDAFNESSTHFTSIGGDNLANRIRTIYWEYRYWIKADFSRINGLINGMFGESILFHSCNLNQQDIINKVKYPVFWKNIVNAIFMIMVACGIALSRKTKLMQLLLCFLSIDVFIHLVCCFGISELYIFSPHFLFIYIISIGYLIKRTSGFTRLLSITATALIACILYINNITEIVHYLTDHPLM